MKAVISGFARSPFHLARKGGLAQIRPDELAAQFVRGLFGRNDLVPALLDDVILGCAYPEASQGNYLAHIVSALAGLPKTIGGITISRFCGSSVSAVHVTAANIEADLGGAYLCIGVESKTMVPQGGFNFSSNSVLLETTDTYISRRQTSENVAQCYRIARTEQELMAVQSYRKASNARESGLLTEEIVSVISSSGGNTFQDGCMRPATSVETLTALPPAFIANGVVIAGTSSPLTNGAAVVLVTNNEFAFQHRLHPLERIRPDRLSRGRGGLPSAQGAAPRHAGARQAAVTLCRGQGSRHRRASQAGSALEARWTTLAF